MRRGSQLWKIICDRTVARGHTSNVLFKYIPSHFYSPAIRDSVFEYMAISMSKTERERDFWSEEQRSRANSTLALVEKRQAQPNAFH